MKIRVRVYPGAPREAIKEEGMLDGDRMFRVWVGEPPVRGLANQAVILLLARHLNVAEAKIKIVAGHTSRNKVIIIQL